MGKHIPSEGPAEKRKSWVAALEWGNGHESEQLKLEGSVKMREESGAGRKTTTGIALHCTGKLQQFVAAE